MTLPFFKLFHASLALTATNNHARVAVTIDHAPRAAIPDELGIVKVVDVAHRSLPEMAAIQIQVPVEIKIFVPAQAAEFFRLLPQMPLHFRERFRRVHHREPAVAPSSA